MLNTPRVGWLGLIATALAFSLAGAQAPPASTAPPGAAPAGGAAATPAPAAAPAAGPVDTAAPNAGAPAPSAAPAPAAQTTEPPLPFTTGKVANGATKAAVCSACHGPNGNSTNPEWPRLAGQNAIYIVEQLRLFRSGVRNNPIMKPLAATLSDQDIADLAVYFEAQTPTGLEADPSYWKSGEAVYLRGDRSA